MPSTWSQCGPTEASAFVGVPLGCLPPSLRGRSDLDADDDTHERIGKKSNRNDPQDLDLRSLFPPIQNNGGAAVPTWTGQASFLAPVDRGCRDEETYSAYDHFQQQQQQQQQEDGGLVHEDLDSEMEGEPDVSSKSSFSSGSPSVSLLIPLDFLVKKHENSNGMTA
eukprot:TRINITY_DN700_c4_g1_i1.p1 TRINITY_DN700_c4_g1~~TRINITY_DN700_c4_g1_i1.p1  ORF type:complete len:177 (+),score=49.36 TRINITY_DN700_c4_g1_i1:34-531(+)